MNLSDQPHLPGSTSNCPHDLNVLSTENRHMLNIGANGVRSDTGRSGRNARKPTQERIKLGRRLIWNSLLFPTLWPKVNLMVWGHVSSLLHSLF